MNTETLEKPDVLKNISTKIFLKRREMGLTQAELAEKIGISQPTLTNLERGGSGKKVINLSSLEKIVTALGMQLIIDAE